MHSKSDIGLRSAFFISDRKGNIQYCKYGNDTDRNSEVQAEN
jgi:hypothetical protein